MESSTDKIEEPYSSTNATKESGRELRLTLFSEHPAIARHVSLLKQRQERTQVLLVSLAKQMFVLSLYLETDTVVVQNGKFGVRLVVGANELGVQMFTKGTDVDKVDWTDLIANIVQSRSVSSIESAVRSKRWRRRHSENHTVGGYNVDSAGRLLRNNIPREYIPLIPTAKILVEELLLEQEMATKVEVAYLNDLDEMTPEWAASAEEVADSEESTEASTEDTGTVK